MSGLPRDVVILSVIAFFVAIGFGVVVPVLPVFAKSFHVDNFAVGAVVSGFAIMRFITAPFCARLIDWAGERVILAAGIGIVAVSSALMAFSASYAQLLLLRSAGGIGSAMFTVSALTRLLGTTPPDLRGRASSIYQGGFLIGSMAGPALGGFLQEISIRAPFLFYAATLTVAGSLGLAFLRHRVAPQAKTAATEIRPFREVVRDVRYQAACAANLAQGWSMMRSALVPLLVVEALGLTPRWTGIAFAAAAVAQALLLGPAGLFTDTRGRKPALVIAGLVAAVLMLVLPLAPNYWVLLGVMCLLAVPSSLQSTAPAAAVGDAAGGRGGRAVAVFSMCADAGSIAGPLVAGWLADVLSLEAAFGTAAALFLLAAVWAAFMPGRAGRATRAVPGPTGA